MDGALLCTTFLLLDYGKQYMRLVVENLAINFGCVLVLSVVFAILTICRRPRSGFFVSNFL